MIYTLLCFSSIAVTLINGQEFADNSYGPNDHQLDARDDDGRRIIHSQFAREKQFPFMVALIYEKKMVDGFKEDFTCGGTIIHPRWVLTAAHCIYFNRGGLQVLAGAVYVIGASSKSGKLINVAELIPHPKYFYLPPEKNFGVERVENDIGLLRLHESLEWTPKIRPITLEMVPREYYDTERAIVVGWGFFMPGEKKISARLRWTELRLMFHFACKLHFPYTRVETHLCGSTRDVKRSVCKGDSGGPVILKGIQIGVISTANDFCLLDKEPNLFTKVSHFYSWIDEKMRLFHEYLPSPQKSPA